MTRASNIFNPATTKRLYWLATGLFCLMFVFSAVWSIVDPAGAVAEYRQLQFPNWLVYPLSIAKLLGVVAILANKSQTLKNFAYAGFLYDLLLAMTAHIYNGEDKVVLALFGLALWAAAFGMDRVVLRSKAQAAALFT